MTGLGRFTQPDSIVPNLFDPQSLNRYSYVLNNPVRYTDPTGHMAEDDWGQGGGGNGVEGDDPNENQGTQVNEDNVNDY